MQTVPGLGPIRASSLMSPSIDVSAGLSTPRPAIPRNRHYLQGMYGLAIFNLKDQSRMRSSISHSLPCIPRDQTWQPTLAVEVATQFPQFKRRRRQIVCDFIALAVEGPERPCLCKLVEASAAVDVANLYLGLR